MNLRLLLLTSLLVGCTQRRAYPLMAFHDTDGADRLELGAAALLPSQLLVAIHEKDSETLYEVAPVTEDGRVRTLTDLGRDAVDLFELDDPSQRCADERDSPRWHRCRNRSYRSTIPMEPRPIHWLPSSDGRVIPPFHIEDLTAFPHQDQTGPDRVLGVTEFSTIGRITGFRADQVTPAREAAERLFVLERSDDGWNEVRVPSVEVLRQALSDWGRARCDQDLVVEGLAYDPDSLRVYIGVNRCLGPAQAVLMWDLGSAEAGGAVSLTTVADGVTDGSGHSIAWPSEGISSLDVARGQLWASTSWDDWGFEHEPIYGARLSAVRDGALRPVDTAAPLRDRADALVVLPTADRPDDLSALVLFDNDHRSPTGVGLNGTLVYAVTPAPSGGRFVEVLSLEPSPFGNRALGLNGFDFRWYWRDHRVGQMLLAVDRWPTGPGAWTSGLGGLWQARLGAAGRFTRPILGKAVGHDRRAVAVTDYRPAKELSFTSYKAVLSVIPRERTGDERSIAQLLERIASDYDVVATLPQGASDDAGLVLQGFIVDTSPRATGGVCMVALDLGVDWATADHDAVRLRGLLLGGLCNDFNTRASEEHHGLTTDASAGVRITLFFAVVEGAPAHRASVTVAERDRAGARNTPTALAWVDDLNDRAPYRTPGAPDRVGNHTSKDRLACIRADPEGGVLQVLRDEMVNAEWLAAQDGTWPDGPAQAGRAGSVSRFAFALDLRGFEPGTGAAEYAAVTELEARNQNAYFYRYLLQAWPHPDGGLFVEGGATHGLHRGLGRDGSLPTAHLLATDVTWWDDLSVPPVQASMIAAPAARDPNVQPEDGYVRWAWTEPVPQGGPTCSSD